MTRTSRRLLALGAAALLGTVEARFSSANAAPVAPAAARQTSYSICGIRAFSYFQETGQFGQKDLALGNVALWNVPFGGPEAPTAATLVLVDLVGPVFAARTQGTLEIQARAGNQSLLSTRVRLSAFFSEKDRISIPFILYGTGCVPVEISASVTGATNKVEPKKASVPFRCGE